MPWMQCQLLWIKVFTWILLKAIKVWEQNENVSIDEACCGSVDDNCISHSDYNIDFS